MADTIDSLQIELSANATSAERSLGKLADTLIRLQSSLKGLSGGQFQNLSSGIQQLSASMQQFSGTVKTADFTRIATGLNKLSAVNVQGVSAASKAINNLTTNLSKIGTIAFDSQGIVNVANAIAQLGRKTVTQASSNIPLLAQSLQSLVTGLNQIGAVKFDVSSLAELTSSITKLGGKSATNAASGNITKLAIALKEMMKILSSSPKVSQNLIQMTQALAQLATTGSRAGTATNTLVKSFNLLPSSTAKAKSGFNGLAGAIGKFYATYWLLIRGIGQFKKAIDISSALTEVQNVVDVSFGDMSNKMDEFARSALNLYGMSELTAKQIGSRFQAMGVSMGFAQEDMTEMSIRLTQLAGDLASFYNLAQEDVAKKLQSIFTGETEPLRSLGLDLSFATVEAWALSQGIDADMRSMTQAEKTMLRYQYVLANTGAATNDFVRTQNSWANQLRLLTGAFEQLGSIVGGVLVNAFKPFIQALNNVMGAVINFAQVVSDALGAIFGWEYQTGGGVANDMESAAGAAGDLEDATGGAAKNAKELNRYIAAWHEVNNMTSDEGSKGSGGGGAGGGGLAGAADGGQWIQTESLWEKYTSSIDSLYKLGDYIGKTLTDAMNSIDWDSVYESARNFGTGLASFLNGLISPELFGTLGTTIAGALNTALYALNSFGTTFEWTEFGISIATGINNFFSTYDFGTLGETINVWANGVLDALLAGIDRVDWKKIGVQIGTFLEKIDFMEIGGKVAQAIWKAINAGLEVWKGMFNAAPIETALLSILTIVTKLDKIKTLATLFTSLGSKAKASAKKVTTLVTALQGNQSSVLILSQYYPKLFSTLQDVTKGFEALKASIKNGDVFGGLNTAISGIRNNLTGIQKAAITAGSGFAEFSLIKDSMTELASGTEDVVTNLIKLGAGAATGAAGMYVALGPTGLAIAAITGVVAAIWGIRDAFKEIDAEKAGEDIAKALTEPRGTPISDVADSFSDSMDKIGEGFENIAEKSSGIENANQSLADTWGQIEHIELSMESGVMSIEEGTAKLNSLFDTLASTAEQKFGSLETTLLAAYGENGAIAQTMERLGISTENTMQAILQVNDKAMERIKEITDELSTLDPTNPKYAELKQELADLIGTTDEVSQAVSDYELKIGNTKIDYSGLLADDNTLDSAKLSDFLLTITSAIDDADTDIELGVSSIKTSLTEELNAALSVGDMQSAEEIKEQLDALPQAMDLLESDIREKGTSVSDAVQIDFLSKIDEEIDSAQKRWEEMSWWEKLFSGFSSEDEYVKNAVEEFKTNYIDPLTEQIESAYDEVGINGAGFASDAAEDIIDSLFETTISYASGGTSATSVELNDNYKTMLQEALEPLVSQVDPDVKSVSEGLASSFISHADSQKEDISEAFAGYAAYSEEGFRKKIEELTKTSTPSVMGSWVSDGIQSPFTKALGIESPSTVFNGYGKNTVEGFNNGISENQSSSQGVIGTWVSKIKGWFTEKLDINSPSGIFEDYAMYTVEGYNEGLSVKMSSTYAIIKKWADGIMGSFNNQIPVVDIGLDTSQYQFTPTKINVAEVAGKVQESLNYILTARDFIDYNQLGEAVYQAQSQAMKENPVQIGDKDVFDANVRETKRFGQRTHKNPYPIY